MKTSDAIFAIAITKNYVQLYFMRGTELADPDGLFEGTGKKLRHVKIKEPAELNRLALRRLVKRAVAQSRNDEGS